MKTLLRGVWAVKVAGLARSQGCCAKLCGVWRAKGTIIEDPPGMRLGITMKRRLAYLRDLDGSKLCGLSFMG